MYIDPGTGSIIIQAIIAALLGVGVIVKIFWRRISGFFNHRNLQNEGDNKDSKKENG